MVRPVRPNSNKLSVESTDVSAPQEVSIRFEAPGCVMGHWRNIVFTVWATPATLPLIEELEKLSRHVLRDNVKVSTVQLLINGAAVPPSEARVALNDLIVRYTDQLACFVTLVEGSGFWASALRSFLTGLSVVQRRSFKTKTCATVPELASWFAPAHAHETGVQVEPQQLVAMITSLLERASIRDMGQPTPR
jgi:hypothetical protein